MQCGLLQLHIGKKPSYITVCQFHFLFPPPSCITVGQFHNFGHEEVIIQIKLNKIQKILYYVLWPSTIFLYINIFGEQDLNSPILYIISPVTSPVISPNILFKSIRNEFSISNLSLFSAFYTIYCCGNGYTKFIMDNCTDRYSASSY